MRSLAVISAITLCLSGCMSAYTQQQLNKSAMLSPGMSKQEVQEIMGPPIKTEFSGNALAWHYCKTGWGTDEHVTVILQDEKVIQSRTYAVTLQETGGATGDCSKFIRPVNFRAADTVNEIRLR